MGLALLRGRSLKPNRTVEGAKSTLESPRWATHAALLVVQIAFASQAVEAKLAMLPRARGGEAIAPEAIAMVRMIGGALFFQAISFFGRASAEPTASLDKRVHARLLALGLLGVALNQALFLGGLRRSSPFVVSVIGATIPVFAAGLSVLLRKEPASARTGLGLVLAIAGVLWLAGVGAVHVDPGESLGAWLVTLNSLSYAAYVVLSRGTIRSLGTFRTMAWVFTYAALLFAPIGIPALASTELTARGVALLAFIVAVPTVMAYGLNAWALARSTPTIVTIYIYVQPLLAGALARLQLGTPISARAAVSAMLIAAGVGVTTIRRR
jgi:drug/metabolite transporter (DMT)-like permease